MKDVQQKTKILDLIECNAKMTKDYINVPLSLVNILQFVSHDLSHFPKPHPKSMKLNSNEQINVDNSTCATHEFAFRILDFIHVEF
jgi:hypothetical protein